MIFFLILGTVFMTLYIVFHWIRQIYVRKKGKRFIGKKVKNKYDALGLHTVLFYENNIPYKATFYYPWVFNLFFKYRRGTKIEIICIPKKDKIVRGYPLNYLFILICHIIFLFLLYLFNIYAVQTLLH